METIKNFFNRVDAKLLIIEFVGLVVCFVGFSYLIISELTNHSADPTNLILSIVTFLFLWVIEFRKVHFTVEVNEVDEE